LSSQWPGISNKAGGPPFYFVDSIKDGNCFVSGGLKNTGWNATRVLELELKYNHDVVAKLTKHYDN
jgi:hypothetical protein